MSLIAIYHRLLGLSVLGIGLPLVAVFLPAIAAAAPPKAGDFVMVTWPSGTSSCCQVVTLDAASLTASVITSGGYIVDPQDIAVSAQGDIYVTVPTTGVVRVDAVSGAQTIFASETSLEGGTPVDIVVGQGGMYVTIRGNPARVVQLDATGSVTRVVSSGGLLTLPAGLAIGPDGALYVCETIPSAGAIGGGLVRIDPTSGAQSLVSSADPLHGPFDVALAPDGSLWSVQRSFRLHGRRGVLVRTALPDGTSEKMTSTFDNVSGIAIRRDGLTMIGDCAPVHGDCYYASARVYPDGPYASSSSDGPIAVVPDITTNVARPSWGRLKLIYR